MVFVLDIFMQTAGLDKCAELCRIEILKLVPITWECGDFSCSATIVGCFCCWSLWLHSAMKFRGKCPTKCNNCLLTCFMVLKDDSEKTEQIWFNCWSTCVLDLHEVVTPRAGE